MYRFRVVAVVLTLMADCFFKLHLSSLECNSSNRSLSTAGAGRIQKIIKSSKERCDNLYIGLQSKLDEYPNTTITCHRSCVSSYTSSSHIQRHLKRCSAISESSFNEMPPTKRLPSQNVPESKVQLIDMICEELLVRVKLLQASNSTGYHRLVVTASQDIPKDVYMGTIIQRCDLKTSHEEADVIIPQQVVHIAAQGIRCISVVCDDTDVFLLLLHYYHKKKLSCYLLMEGTTSQRTTTDIAATVKKHTNIVP